MDTHTNGSKTIQQALSILPELRRKKKLGQAEVAEFFGVRRETVSEWENGRSVPQMEKRDRFIAYFVEKLDLKSDPDRLVEIWQRVAVDVWKWRPLSEAEINGSAVSASNVASPSHPAYFWIGAGALLAILLGVSWLVFGNQETAEPLGVFDIVSSTGNSYQVADSPLQIGSIIYSDRNFVFTEVPDSLVDATYIITANGDKRKGAKEEDSYELKFSINRPAMVCVGYDRRFEVDERPSWLSEFALQDGGTTALKFSPPSGDFTTTLHLYCADFPAGEVTLGPNMTPAVEDADNKTMYTVLLK